MCAASSLLDNHDPWLEPYAIFPCRRWRPIQEGITSGEMQDSA
jgi:hypothetical protein